MSWLSAVTGKAEDFLNQLDKSAAKTFQIDKNDDAIPIQAPVSIPQTPFGGVPSAPTSSKLLSPSYSVPSRLHEMKSGDPSFSFVSSPVKQSPLKSAAPKASTASDSKTKKDSDEALFEFLNSKDPVEVSKKKSTPASSAHHSRQSSTSSNVSHKDVKPVETVLPLNDSPPSLPPAKGSESHSRRESPTGSSASADIEALADAMQESPANSEHSNPDIVVDKGAHSQLSSLELENRLLRNEVASLNQEMVSVIQRAKDSESELMKLKKKLSENSSMSSKHDQIVRELQSRETDLMEALTAKDSQLAVLRVRLEEADRDVKNKKKLIDNLQMQRERILQDHSDSSGMHGQALDTLKDKLLEVEAALAREQEAYKRSQQESAERQSRLEQEQVAMAEAVTAVERKLGEERARVSDLTNQLKSAKSSVEASRHELAEYKDKASRILQSKERLIASLREGSGASGDSVGVSNLEYDSVKQERDMFRDELQQNKLVLENMKMEMQDLETQLQQESDTAQEQMRSLEEQLSEEKSYKEDAEQELLKQKQELQYAIDELHKQKTAFQSCMKDRENEIDKLRNQLMTKSISSTTESELESRVRALTDSLIQKQTMLEALSTEKSSLVLQLERLEQQYRDIQNCVSRSTPTVVSVNDDEEVRQRMPGFMKEGPSDTEVTRRMKRAANVIDRFSVRLGIFLRRYPIARVFVILYMVMLHLWVMIVLLTYQPEVHGADYQPKPPSEGK